MAHLIEVAFKGNRKDFFIWEQDEIPPLKAPVVVEADRGEDVGRVHAVGEQAARRNAGASHGYGSALPARRARRLAGTEDLRRLAELRDQDDEARRRAQERVKANDLPMKVSDAEWQWDRKKLTFYFTADKRVDFRNLVRELASTFRTRIELKQIGVRDEAKRLDGVGRCGRQYCSASWLPELLPVNLGVAKDQRLSLNPTQISGACGRLMCCLRYEHEFYVKSRKRFPKEGRPLVTSRGEEKVLAVDIFRERVTLRGVDGEPRIVPLAELREDVATFDPNAAWLRARPVDAEAPELVSADREADAALESEPADEPAPSAAADEPPAVEPASSEAAPGVEAGAAPSGERRPHRRRGRRGGRRNRGGPGSTGPGPSSSGA
ncbi:MAG TPA: regulatory iron-sulfur-containing complex subunit RicT [Gemmatimonadaceae bacterium]|nr:regulatory iron-sulfur-containing complex subunit RicT [Gemmatimonadaceae bacterium]